MRDGFGPSSLDHGGTYMKPRPMTFGEMNFGKAELGDKRRTDRLVTSADLMRRRPGGSLPQKFRAPKDLRAFYRLMNCAEVTQEAVLSSHRAASLENLRQLDSPVLIVHDATELDFTTHTSLNGLGQIGNGHHRGYIVHNSLAVEPNTRQVLGLCNQVLHQRATVRKNETTAQKRKRKTRESLLWLKGTQLLPADPNLVDICDQGADTFEFLEHELQSGRRFVIRAAYNRGILIGHADAETEVGHLRTYAGQLPAVGEWTLRVTSKVAKRSPKKNGKKKTVQRTAREARLAVSMAAVRIKPPQEKNGDHGNQPLPIWVVRVWEINPPVGQERLEWFLLTNEPLKTFEDAYRVVGWYESRWTIEEYHKGMKTGCKIESPQFMSEQALQPSIALISIITLTLLSMRDASRRPDARQRMATEVISEDYVAVLSAWRHGKIKTNWSIHEFYYALARLGGHQNRKNDHPPGWQVLWEGWTDLQAMLCGYDAMKLVERCG